MKSASQVCSNWTPIPVARIKILIHIRCDSARSFSFSFSTKKASKTSQDFSFGVTYLLFVFY